MTRRQLIFSRKQLLLFYFLYTNQLTVTFFYFHFSSVKPIITVGATGAQMTTGGEQRVVIRDSAGGAGAQSGNHRNYRVVVHGILSKSL